MVENWTETISVWIYQTTEDEKLKNELFSFFFEKYKNCALKVASKLKGFFENDFVAMDNERMIGLHEALSNFDESKGTKLSSHIYNHMKWRLLNEVKFRMKHANDIMIRFNHQSSSLDSGYPVDPAEEMLFSHIPQIYELHDQSSLEIFQLLEAILDENEYKVVVEKARGYRIYELGKNASSVINSARKKIENFFCDDEFVLQNAY